MAERILLYISSALPFIWGVAHFVPTKSIVEEFEPISKDSTRIITMEWITEGVTLIFIAMVIFLVTTLDYKSPISKAMYWASFAVLNMLSGVSLFTGFQFDFLPFRLCPTIFTGNSMMILVALLISKDRARS